MVVRHRRATRPCCAKPRFRFARAASGQAGVRAWTHLALLVAWLRLDPAMITVCGSTKGGPVRGSPATPAAVDRPDLVGFDAIRPRSHPDQPHPEVRANPPSSSSGHPCIYEHRRSRGKLVSAVADGKPQPPRALKPVAEHGLPSVDSVSPNSRKGREASPHARGRERNRMFVGIDVSKERLDVHLCPGGEALAVPRDGKGLADLVERLGALPVELVVLEATGGFETVAAAALAAARLPLAVVNPRQIRDFARATGKLAKTDALDAAVIGPLRRGDQT